MGITIKDVAAVAGVSAATVSRVLTGSDKVAPETAEHVKTIVENLGYQPDRVARALRQRRTNLLGYVVPNLNNPAVLQLLAALELELSSQELILAVASSADKIEGEVAQVNRLLAQGIDGLFIIPFDTENSAKTLTYVQEEGLPVVQLLRRVNEPAIDYVATDYAAGIRQVVRHLAREGQRSIAFVGEGAITSIGEEQLRAFVDAVEDLTDVEQHAIRVGGVTTEFGRQATLGLLEQEQRPDAIICGNDLIAVGALQVLEMHNLTVRDIAITGFDGLEPATYLNSKLTTTGQPTTRLAQEAMRLMSQRLSGLSDAPVEIRISPHLIVRSSA